MFFRPLYRQTMLKDLNADQLKLAQLMSNISEKGYSAGWMQGLEFALWEALIGGDKNYGRHRITQSEIEELKSLSEKCSCWIVFDDNHEELSMKIKEWQREFNEGKSKRTYQQIDEILWNDWDPIGVNEMPEARDEYNSYVLAVLNLKLSGAELETIAQYLFQIEVDRMGLFGNLDNCRRVSQIVCNLAL